MESTGSILLELLIVIVAVGSLVVGALFLHRQNKAKTERTQALFGVGAAPAGPAPGSRPAVVSAKRTYTWPDRIGYYVTFQPDGMPPAEVEVTFEWYGYLNPGDRGLVVIDNGLFCGFHKAS